jgi:uncharacterized UPF0160 family protein
VKIAVTHNGVFHADETAAYALLCYVMKKLIGRIPVVLQRTRDPKAIAEADVVFDVGLVYDPASGRLDHHQEDGLPTRECGIPYSSFGLMFDWLKPALRQLGLDSDALDAFELHLVLPIDAGDNGKNLVKGGGYEYLVGGESVEPIILQRIISTFVPRWDEEASLDEGFDKAVDFMWSLIANKLDGAAANKKAVEIVNDVVNLAGLDAKILDFGRAFLPWQKALQDTGSEALFVLFFDNPSGSWRVSAVPKVVGQFGNKLNLPQMDELPEDSRIREGLVFVHKAGFIAGGTKEACLALAELAVSQL